MYKVGDWIRFIYTGAAAEILEVHTEGRYTVWLEEDDEEIVAFQDDFVLEEEFKGVQASKNLSQTKKQTTESLFFSKKELKDRELKTLREAHKKRHPSIEKPKQTYSPNSTSFVKSPINPIPPTDQGLFLALWECEAGTYSIQLINDSPHSIGFDFEFFLEGISEHTFQKVIPPYEFFSIGDLYRAELNEQPKLQIICKTLCFQKTIKPKYSQLLKNKQIAPLMGAQVHLYPLFKKLTPLPIPGQNPTEELLIYTKQNWQPRQQRHAYYELHSVVRRAAFEQVIDLHIEKLVPDPKALSAHDKLNTQLEYFDELIQEAISLQVPYLFVIHGVGKGRLRNEITQRLKKNIYVASFNNNHHPKYGFGATQIYFKKSK